MWIRAQLVCILYVILCVTSNTNEPATSKEKNKHIPVGGLHSIGSKFNSWWLVLSEHKCVAIHPHKGK